MQRAEEIDISKIGDIVSSIFQETAIAYEDYSAFDSELKKYESETSLIHAIEEAYSRNAHSANFAIYYPDAKGYFFIEKRVLNPDKCNGATYRYISNGWGLVHLQIDFRKRPVIEVHVSVNTAKRAEAWVATYPEFKEPSLWDWKYVEKQTRRIIRVLKKCA